MSLWSMLHHPVTDGACVPIVHGIVTSTKCATTSNRCGKHLPPAYSEMFQHPPCIICA